MSVESISLVLNASRASGTAKLVLIGIANHDGDGGAWPSIATLARYANTSERSVQRAIEQLVELGEVVVHAQAGGTHNTRADRRPNRYQITLTQPVDNRSHGVTPVSPRTGHGVTLMTPRGDAGDVHGVTPASPEPSLNHPEPAAARGRGPMLPQIEALAAGFADVPGLDSLIWTMHAEHQATVAELVDRHGVPRLVRAAIDTKTGNIRRGVAFLTTWLAIPDHRFTVVAGPGEICPGCARPATTCEAANRRLDEENRCHGRETA